MITAGFLIEVFFGGLIAVGVIPIINLAIFAVRESHRSDTGMEISIEAPTARTSKPTRRRQSLATKSQNVPHYVASNGVIITPSIEFARLPNGSRQAAHPHSEYWTYGNVAYYA